jgi:hypothetical protein
MNSGRASSAPPTDPRVQELVGRYCVAYRSTHGGANPSKTWRQQAGSAVKRLLPEATFEELAICLDDIAHQNKAPTTLNHVLADFQSHQAKQAVG